MKLSKQRKVYAGVLGLAFVALAADRVFLGGAALSPQSAMATDAPDTSITRTAALESPAPAPSTRRTLAVRLEALRTGGAADGSTPSTPLFGSEPAWLAPPSPPATVAQTVPAPPKESIADVLARHRVGAVVAGEPRSLVMVDGKWMSAGQSFDGVTILLIKKASVTFARGAERHVVDFEQHARQE